MALKDNWVMWLAFDDVTSVFRDYSGNGNNASAISGIPPFTAIGGKPNGYITTSLGNAGLGVSDNANLTFLNTSPFTMHFWVKPSIIVSTQRYIFFKRDASNTLEYQLVINTNGSIGITCWRIQANFISYDSPAATLVINVWAHLVLVWDGTNFILYKNGALFNTAAPITTGVYLPGMVNTTSALYVLSGAGAINFFEGDADNLALRASVTTPDEVQTLYNGGNGYNPFIPKGSMMSFF